MKINWNRIFIKRLIDQYINIRIERFLAAKNLLLPEEIKRFAISYDALMWDRAKKAKQDKLIKNLSEHSKIFCYTDSILCLHIYTEIFENNEILFTKRYLKTGETFIDIGANIGLFSIIAAEAIGSSGSIVSFEPSPITYKRLLENIDLNSLNENISAYQLAVSNQDETLNMNVAKRGYDAWDSLATPSIDDAFTKVPVQCVKIDNFANDSNAFEKANLIKIDVEGWELNVLKGGYEYFKRNNAPTLLVEFTDINAHNAGTTCKDLYLFLNELGYNLYRFNPHDLSLTFQEIKSSFPYDNLIATKNLKEAEERLKRQ